jgi:hypothetical protein
MPIWLRKFTFTQIQNYYLEEKEAIENKSSSHKGKQTLIDSDGTIKSPDLLKNSKSSNKPVKYG